MTGTHRPGRPAICEGLAGQPVYELLLLVADAARGGRDNALKVLLDGGIASCYPQLEEAVRNDSDADMRNGAMEVLVRFGPAAVARLVRLLNDENEEVRNFSTVMLGDIGCRDAVAPLIRALDDPDVNVRHGAAEALGKIGDATAVQPLLEMRKGDLWDRWYADAALQLLSAK